MMQDKETLELKRIKESHEHPIYASNPWKIARIDAGMGETDYIVMLNDVFFCRTDKSQTAHKIITACKKYWDYRADSGHLYHLLYDLLGEEFVTSHRLDESIVEVFERLPEIPLRSPCLTVSAVLAREFAELDKKYRDTEDRIGEAVDLMTTMESLKRRLPEIQKQVKMNREKK